MSLQQPALSVRGVGKSFVMHLRGGIVLPVVANVGFDVSAGECVVLGGPSGIGKSSILRMVYGNYAVDTGSIRLATSHGVVDIAQGDPRAIMAARRDAIGYVSQFLRALPRIGAVDVVAEPLVARGVSVEEARGRARTMLRRLNLRLDQDDRIALLGRNGQGKSTLSKLLAGRLAPMEGRLVKSPRLRVGYFAQHQVDELHLDETPLDHVRSLRPNEAPARLRARLAGFGLMEAQAETRVGALSGGQKARLSLLLATIDAPHLLILDEPTNHLDIESREALTEALNDYTGAVVLVSHDMHLLELVADRLWLVADGAVTPYADDLDTYRRSLLASDEPKAPAPPPKAPARRASRDEILELRAEARRGEERVEKLTAMLEKISARMADPTLYDDPAEAEKWGRKHAEASEALPRAEALWMEALERLEAAERG